MPRDTERQNSILTSTDREYLVGEKNYEAEQSVRDRTAAIRSRIKSGLLDFDLLLERPQHRDFQTISDYVETDPENEYYDGLTGMIGFALRLADYAGADEKRLLEATIKRNDPMLKDVNVDIERTWREGVNTTEVRNKIENGELPSAYEIGVAVFEGELENDHLEVLSEAKEREDWGPDEVTRTV